MADHPIFAPILQGWLAASTPIAEQPITKAYRLSTSRTPLEAGVALACRVILEHDEETTPPDVGCYECTLGTVPRAKENGPCLYHQACELLREAGLEA